nr:maltose alpha-D-glucosyltransferase [Variibacter gotjawalensis]
MPQIDAATSTGQDDDWYRDAIIYQLHVKAFADSNGDGVGDFQGLTEKLDYLLELGVTCVWLLPFYPSPQRDDGYDIADYGDVNPMYGAMKDFRRFMAEAKRRGLRVITELVINHTSDQHQWFKRAQRSPKGSSARNWYVWSDTDQKFLETRIIFTDTEKSNWSWDPVAGQYYWHRFFSHQPDLNFDNPRVVSAVVQVMKRWLDTGVDGFRLDAIPYLVEREGTNNENLPETHVILKKLRQELDAYAPGKLFLAEANQWPEDVSAYFGDGDECHMCYHFPLMPRIYMAIAQEDRFPIADILRQTPDIPANCQWALFLRNHDELTLEMVTDSERDYLWSTYAADPRARINVGIRRRLAPLMDNDRRKIELMNALLMSLPGTPIVYYGDEIGMGDNIYLGDRNGVRTPMQWTPDRNGGFSRADPARLFSPVIMDPVYGYQTVNVEAQSHSLSSLLSWMKRLIAVRKSTKVFGRGSLSFIRPENRSVLCYVRQWGDETILCVANLSRTAQAAELDLAQFKGRIPLEMLGRTQFPAITDAPFVVTLAPYGFFWFQLTEPKDGRATRPTYLPERATVVVKDGWGELLAGRARGVFERDVLPVYLPAQRWFAEKGSRWIEPKIASALTLTHGDPGFLWMLLDVGAERGKSQYAVPLKVDWSSFDRSKPAERDVIAPVRKTAREGVLLDAAFHQDFVTWLIGELHAGRSFERDGHRLQLRPSETFASGELVPVNEVKPMSGEQSNTTVFVDRRYIVKFFRRVSAGINPDIEISRYLTDVAKFPNSPALVGSVELETAGGCYALAIVQELVENQGDGWSTTSTYLDRFLEEARLLQEPLTPDHHAAFLLRMSQIGKRTAEVHRALVAADEPAFVPEPISAEDRAKWSEDLSQYTIEVFQQLLQRLSTLPDSIREIAETVVSRRDEILVKIKALIPDHVSAQKIRHHGDYHLGQVLIVKDDIFILDFEGEPERPIEDRRQKAPGLRDLAGMVRSVDYAATAALDRMVISSADDNARLAPHLEEWRAQCVTALTAAYKENATDKRIWPDDDAAAERMLSFFIVEKAVHEIAYELANRPSWLHVPLRGILRLLFPEEEVKA